MQRRRSIPRSKSKRYFSKTANKTHKFNTGARPMRGGIRL